MNKQLKSKVRNEWLVYLMAFLLAAYCTYHLVNFLYGDASPFYGLFT